MLLEDCGVKIIEVRVETDRTRAAVETASGRSILTIE